MRLAALFSGGKDSAYSTYLAMKAGHEIKQLVSFASENPVSYMFHHPNVWLTKMQAESAGIPLLQFSTKGEKEKELEDLENAIASLDVEGIVSGAIASDYQKKRVDRICEKLNITSIAPLWKKPQKDVALEEAQTLDSIIVSVSAEGLGKEWLGRKFDEECVRELVKLNAKTGLSVVGEGGEFETLVLNAPFFRKMIEITSSQVKWNGSTGVLEVTGARPVI